MKIGLDLRFINDDLYSKFVLELVKELTNINHKDNYTIYTNSHLPNISKTNNIEIKKVCIKNGTLKEQFSFLKILKNDKNNIIIFFNHYKPVFYKQEYYILTSTLKDIYY
jgi:hypothetical protein